MNDMTAFKVGPVLSYRKTRLNGEVPEWCVTALLGIDDEAQPPVLTLDGLPAPAPRKLASVGGTAFHRYDLVVPLREHERRVRYAFSGMSDWWEFTVPASDVHLRCAYVSCNGFSDAKEMRKLHRPAGAVWSDLVRNHDRELDRPDPPDGKTAKYVPDKEERWHIDQGNGTIRQRFHLLVMGGDQVYLDGLWDDIPELTEWSGLSAGEQVTRCPSPGLADEIQRYIFKKYCDRWVTPAAPTGPCAAHPKRSHCADAVARIPTIMMWDDHDIFDGWGSYSEPLQKSPVAQAVFKAAREAFWVFQLQHELAMLPTLQIDPDREASDAPQFTPQSWSQRLETDPMALPLLDGQPGFSSAFDFGSISALVLDLRTERSRKQILSAPTWSAVTRALNGEGPCPMLGSTASTHMLVFSSVPVVHPKLSGGERMLDLLRGEDVVDSLLDDVCDQWSHKDHEDERCRLTRLLMRHATTRKRRVCIVSGDVHLAGLGMLYRTDAGPRSRWLRIPQLTSSGVMHPPPSGAMQRLFVSALNITGPLVQKIDSEHACEMRQFPSHDRCFMPTRNWLSLEIVPTGSAERNAGLWASWRCEQADGFSNHLLEVHQTREYPDE